jgi:ABC-type sugar transport system permease subunit
MIIWRNFGFTTLLILTAIIQVSPEYYDAAEVDGASFVKKMIHITLPIIRPILLFILITGTSWTFQLYDDISMLFPGSIGGPRHSTLTIVWYIYDAAFGRTTRYGYASALCYGMFVIIAICTFLSFKVGKSEGL